MAWVGTNPVTVGDPTKKKNYDTLWDNVQHIKTDVMSSGTVMLFGQNSPPTGWTRKTGWTPGSGFANIVYSSGNASTGGATPATTDLVFTQAAHNHQWYNFQGSGNSESYNSGGTSTDLFAGFQAGETVSVAGSTCLGADYYTNNKTPAITKTTAFKYVAVIAAVKDAY